MMNDKSCPQTPHHLPSRQGRGSHAAQRVWFSSRLWINNRLVSFNVFVHIKRYGSSSIFYIVIKIVQCVTVLLNGLVTIRKVSQYNRSCLLNCRQWYDSNLHFSIVKYKSVFLDTIIRNCARIRDRLVIDVQVYCQCVLSNFVSVRFLTWDSPKYGYLDVSLQLKITITILSAGHCLCHKAQRFLFRSKQHEDASISSSVNQWQQADSRKCIVRWRKYETG